MNLSPDQVAALVTAVLLILASLNTYVLTRVQQLGTTSKRHSAALNGPVNDLAARVNTLESGGGLAAAHPVPPAWNQLDDPISTGALPAQRTQECGEEVAAEIIMWKHGVPMSADALRALLKRPDGSALTTAADVAGILHVCNTNGEPHAMSADDAQKTIRLETGAGRPVAVLVKVPTGGYHWLCAYSSDDQFCHYNDPWGGVRISQGWPALLGRYAGSLVTVAGIPDSEVPTAP